MENFLGAFSASGAISIFIPSVCLKALGIYFLKNSSSKTEITLYLKKNVNKRNLILKISHLITKQLRGC